MTELDRNERRGRRAQVMEFGVGGVAEPLIVIAEDHPERWLVQLQPQAHVRLVRLAHPGRQSRGGCRCELPWVAPIADLAQLGEAVWPQNGPDHVSIDHRLAPWEWMESELRIRLEDGDDIVVVGVEPLCHLPRFA